MADEERLSQLHQGHRERMKKRFLKSGFDGFYDYEILEMLLYYAVPRKDTNEMAHKLINACGSLSAVFDAPVSFLTENGVSLNTAIFLKSFCEASRQYLKDKFYNGAKYYTIDYLKQKIMATFVGLKEERVLLALYDPKGCEQFFGFISRGTFNMSDMDSRKIVEIAMEYRACAAIVAHNHPSGVARPSHEDVDATIILRKALTSMDVELKDHFIVSESVIMSMASDERYKEIFF